MPQIMTSRKNLSKKDSDDVIAIGFLYDLKWLRYAKLEWSQAFEELLKGKERAQCGKECLFCPFYFNF